MKKMLFRACSLLLAACLSFAAGCGKKEEKLKLPDAQEFIETSTWNAAMRKASLLPYWNSREIYNETVVFIGEEGTATLMYVPESIRSVRSFGLETVYEEGRDYVVEGNTIRRVKDGRAPYWKVDEYFLTEPNDAGAVIAAEPTQLEFDFPETRYLRYGEGATFTSKQLAVTYRHAEPFDGVVPKGQREKLGSVLGKLERAEPLRVFVYGDSVAEGCNASGTAYGGNVSPYMPDGFAVFCEYLEERFGSEIALENRAKGGWRLLDCVNNYDTRLKDEDIDLLILRIGGNDGYSNEIKYVTELDRLLDKFFADHPEAEVIIQTPETANSQSTWVLNVGQVEPWTLLALDGYAHSDRIAVAKVGSFAKWIQATGKRDRDWLGNNVNHPNDFMIRLYTQILLKTLLGTEFTEEIYE